MNSKLLLLFALVWLFALLAHGAPAKKDSNARAKKSGPTAIIVPPKKNRNAPAKKSGPTAKILPPKKNSNAPAKKSGPAAKILPPKKSPPKGPNRYEKLNAELRDIMSDMRREIRTGERSLEESLEVAANRLKALEETVESEMTDTVRNNGNGATRRLEQLHRRINKAADYVDGLQAQDDVGQLTDAIITQIESTFEIFEQDIDIGVADIETGLRAGVQDADIIGSSLITAEETALSEVQNIENVLANEAQELENVLANDAQVLGEAIPVVEQTVQEEAQAVAAAVSSAEDQVSREVTDFVSSLLAGCQSVVNGNIILSTEEPAIDPVAAILVTVCQLLGVSPETT